MLGKFEWEVLEYMSLDELARWMAYIEIRNDMDKASARRTPL